MILALILIAISIPLIAFEVQASENKNLYNNAIDSDTLLMSGVGYFLVVFFINQIF